MKFEYEYFDDFSGQHVWEVIDESVDLNLGEKKENRNRNEEIANNLVRYLLARNTDKCFHEWKILKRDEKNNIDRDSGLIDPRFIESSLINVKRQCSKCNRTEEIKSLSIIEENKYEYDYLCGRLDVYYPELSQYRCIHEWDEISEPKVISSNDVKKEEILEKFLIDEFDREKYARNFRDNLHLSLEIVMCKCKKCGLERERKKLTSTDSPELSTQNKVLNGYELNILRQIDNQEIFSEKSLKDNILKIIIKMQKKCKHDHMTFTGAIKTEQLEYWFRGGRQTANQRTIRAYNSFICPDCGLKKYEYIGKEIVEDERDVNMFFGYDSNDDWETFSLGKRYVYHSVLKDTVLFEVQKGKSKLKKN